MEKYKSLLGPTEAQKNIRDGIVLAANAITPTLGVRGRKIVIDKEFGPMEVVDDGAMILSQIELENTQQQMGVKMLREAANKTNNKVGDGTTTTSILAAELVKNIVTEEDSLLIKKQTGNVLKTKRELNAGVQKIIEFIDAHKIEVDDKKVAEIGTISSNSEEIGTILSELFKTLGREAPIIVADSPNMETTYEIIEGMKIDKGFIAKAMVTNPEKSEAVMENANVLVTDYKIQNPQDIKTLITLFKDHNINDLLIIADDIQGLPLDFLVQNKMAGIIRIIGIKAPAFGDYHEVLKDIAILTGARLISKEEGLEFKDVHPDKLGKAARVVSTFDSTSIVGGGGDKDKIKERVASIENQIEGIKMEFDKKRLRERISKLGAGIGMIKVGGATEMEVVEKKAKIDDAINAVRAALKEGGIPGGGVMLLRASQILDDKIKGEAILKTAIQKPFEQILLNADFEPAEVKEKVLQSDNLNYGFNVETEEYCDMVEAGVIDPALVAKTALQNAISIALLVLTVSGANALIREKEDKDEN
jgi:chaperonin GroEL